MSDDSYMTNTLSMESATRNSLIAERQLTSRASLLQHHDQEDPHTKAQKDKEEEEEEQ